MKKNAHAGNEQRFSDEHPSINEAFLQMLELKKLEQTWISEIMIFVVIYG